MPPRCGNLTGVYLQAASSFHKMFRDKTCHFLFITYSFCRLSVDSFVRNARLFTEEIKLGDIVIDQSLLFRHGPLSATGINIRNASIMVNVIKVHFVFSYLLKIIINF